MTQVAASGLDAVDMPAVVRGCGRGFLVLVGGGLIAPVLAQSSPLLGAVLLAGAAVVAFGVAAVPQGSTTNGPLHGVLAAIGAYLLVLPLVLLAPAGRDVVQILLTAAAAVAVGAATGWVRQRLRKKEGRS